MGSKPVQLMLDALAIRQACLIEKRYGMLIEPRHPLQHPINQLVTDPAAFNKNDAYRKHNGQAKSSQQQTSDQ